MDIGILILVGLVLFLLVLAILSSIGKAEKARKKSEAKKLDMDYKNRKIDIRNKEIEYKENKLKLDILKKNNEMNNHTKYLSNWYNEDQQESWKQEAFNYEGEEFFDLRQDLNKEWRNDVCGIYIIYNKTKHKYYVGQSIDIYKRVLRQHFWNEYALTKWFHKDWYNGDEFYWRYIECPKDDLNQNEKYYISIHNAYENGYNKTKGNS
mgnify:CR=1 FL=1